VDTAVDVPGEVWLAAGVRLAEVVGVDLDRFGDGTGAASGQVHCITARLRDGNTTRFVQKTLRPVQAGRHVDASRAPEHWAYWRRELLAYRSGILPTGPGLRAPRLLGSAENTLFLEYVEEELSDPRRAAAELGRWHRHALTPDEPWLARHQLAQRLAVIDLDWSAVDVDPRLPPIWSRRNDHLGALDEIPFGITHGDFGIGNLRTDGSDVVALDWATLGISPVGTDLAHLALAILDDGLLPEYLDGLGGRYDRDDVELGYRSTVALVGTSRIHWMTSRSIPVSTAYVEFVCSHAPRRPGGTNG
jgi:hypothetical protein